MVFWGARGRAELVTYNFVIIFAEDPNDAQALEHLLRYSVPSVGVVRRPRRPLVLMKGRPQRAVRSSAEKIAAAVLREAKLSGKIVDLVIAHEDCDDVEPAHIDLTRRIATELRNCGVPNPVVAAPAWEMEAWWYLWPDAVAAVCSGWRRLTRTGAVGMLVGAKEQLRRDLRPTGHSRVPDYDESYAPRIAAQIREHGRPPDKRVRSASYKAFCDALGL